MLHIIKNEAGLNRAKEYASTQDAMILIQDATYLASLSIPVSNRAMFVLHEDLQARGLGENVLKSVQVIDFKGFVSLTEQHESSITWD
ncbi:sulfurtransferase complex subunit TusB [Vibrio methylphosphonaticus]|uniref:sulfurtransferase complex subunit TusB n=1 Tax=Vibrio methylphosphonaticus TaxID=2946866 RepID=UPI00202A1C38|nr:sulfurtransferase complex subunit TusB [Vibrio methylphosphonaticus]MCL9776343.1 sulfurtransferase complex subunit TusB [Vibrio methylphosphonaticus]